MVVQYVQISLGPWLENSEGGLEVQADLYPNASGNAEVFRNGVAIPGTWRRSTLGSPTQFLNAAGSAIPMLPGQTVPGEPRRKPGARWVDPNVRAAQTDMERTLGMRVRIRDRHGKGKIVIEYSTVDDYEKLTSLLRSKK